MPISFNCPSCNAGLSVKEEFAGKNANCPQCGNGFTVPAPGAAAPQGGGININTGGSSPSGGGGININAGGGGAAGGSIPAIGPSGGVAAGGVAAGGVAAGGGAPKPGALPQPGLTPAPAPAAAPTGGAYASPGGMDVRSDAGSAGEPSKRTYPALNLAMQMYTILSTIVLVLGGLAVVVLFIVQMMAASRIGGTAMLLPLITSALAALYVFLMWISLKAAAEFIKLFLNLEHDTHRTANGIRNLNGKLG